MLPVCSARQPQGVEHGIFHILMWNTPGAHFTWDPNNISLSGVLYPSHSIWINTKEYNAHAQATILSQFQPIRSVSTS